MGGDFGLVSSAKFGKLKGVAIRCVLGDQHAASFGQRCFDKGSCKATFGTGCFVMLNTGEPVNSTHGLLTTPLYQIKGEEPVFALEGAVAVAGAAIQWLRDNMRIADSAQAIGDLAASTADNGGVYFVPAFSGLFAPHWDASARGIVAGLTAFATRAHLCRAAIEAAAFGLGELKEAFAADNAALRTVNVDGGMAVNPMLMQSIADLVGVPAMRPDCLETTALGAAYGAGLGTVWPTLADLLNLPVKVDFFCPNLDATSRNKQLEQWAKAVHRARGWLSPPSDPAKQSLFPYALAVGAFVSGALLGARFAHRR